MIEIGLDMRSDGSARLEAQWTVRLRSWSPEPLGQRGEWRQLETFDTHLVLLAPEYRSKPLSERASWLATRLLVPRAGELIIRALGRRLHARVAVRVLATGQAVAEDAFGAAELDALPWEELFGAHGLVVVRRERIASRPPWHAGRNPLQFPVRVAAVDPESDQARALSLHALPDRLREAVSVGALSLESDGAADIVQLTVACSIPDSVLTAVATREPRLVLLCEPTLDHASAATAAHVMNRTRAEAVLHLAGPAAEPALERIYEGLSSDLPLDVIAAGMQQPALPGPLVLRCRDGGESCVSLSGALEAAVVGDGVFGSLYTAAPDGHEPHDVLGQGGAEALLGAWRRALLGPIRRVADASRRLVLGELEGLQRAVTLARDAALLNREGAAGREFLRHIAGPARAELDLASARTAEVHVIDARSGEAPQAGTALVVKRPYRLHVQIVAASRNGAWGAAPFPEAALAATLARLGAVKLEVRINAPPEQVQLDQVSGALELRELGDSDVLEVGFQLHRPGPFEIRVGLYYQAALLQSVLVEGEAGAGQASGRPVEARVDFAASHHLMLLDEIAQPSATIWTHASQDGSHWLGVHTGAAGTACGLANGTFVTFSPNDLEVVSDALRSALLQVELVPAPVMRWGVATEAQYRFASPLDELALEERAGQLARLARTGWDAYNALFPERLPEHSPARGQLHVARCSPGGASIAWAALYDYHLDTDEPTVCQAFHAHVALAATPKRKGSEYAAAESGWLEDPARCRVRPDCPLSDPERANRTVCPFGFWGIRHSIEQPLQHVRRAPDTAATVEPSRAVPSRIELVEPCQPPRLGLAYWSGFPGLCEHLAEISRLGTAEGHSERSAVLGLLEAGNKHVYYFFCHGDAADPLAFALKVDPSAGSAQDTISAADLNHRRYIWSVDQPAPLVFLNGCDTTAFRADTINRLLARFRAMGASGVIGTEIPVPTQLAMEVGLHILALVARGRSLGHAFLSMRRRLLCEQYNPLGLIYTCYASAGLHLCIGSQCRTCGVSLGD